MRDHPGQKLGLRLRIALFFMALALAGIAAIVTGLWLGHARYGGPPEGYVIAGLVAGFALMGLCAWVGYLFDENVARPVLGLASDLETRANASVTSRLDEGQARYLGALAPAARAIDTALTHAREAQQRAIEAQTARLTRDKALFEALLRDLAEGAVVLTPDRRIMLYNRAAQRLLGPLGLDRAIGNFIHADPLLHAIDRLAAQRSRGETEAENFLAASLHGNRFLLGQVSPVTAGDDRIGYVVIFHDATDDLQTHAERDHLFNALLEQVRRPAAAISATLDVLDSDPGMPAETRATFTAAIEDETQRLFASLRDSSARYGAAAARHWPMSEVATQDIFDALETRLPGQVETTDSAHFLRCDGYAIIGLLTRVIEGLGQDTARTGLTIAAEAHDHEIWLILRWQGSNAPDGQIARWIEAPVSQAYGQYTGRDVLDGHRTEIWSETHDDKTHRIVLPLASAGAPVLAPQDARPEFYDFNLPPAPLDAEMANTPLCDLTFVVFDTETTGLSPSGGDEIVQLSGVRVVNGRVLSGEVFDTLVDPGRPIPPASTKIHGISDDMIAGAPDITRAGQDFHDFCEGAVLVAHNAPFDIAFLRLKEQAIGREFRHPVLCTVLLSAALFEHTGQHTLDALAERLGVTIPEPLRHTALGDSVATADVFLKMLGLMRAQGIVTLGDAMNAGQRMTKIRKAQDY